MKKLLYSIGFWALPLFVLAQGFNPFTNILTKVKNILDLVVPIVITLALIYFIWGVAQYVTAKDDDKKAEARDTMIYGTIGLFVIVSVWGIVMLLQQFTGVQPINTPPTLPTIPS
ncbi:hypothetical protein CL630_02930 [bacterium]|nr:hypothetical protein [bacterium]|tara:strand:+ start:292 stop:636 length:345 start_codon:yes stop_codon:yes gene_type:complete